MYFADLTGRFTDHAWYFLLQGAISIVFGLAALIRPVGTVDLLIRLFGLWLLANGLFQILPTILGRTVQRLRGQAVASAATALLVGGLALTRDILTLDAAAVILGMLLIFRAVLELAILVEAHMRALHQRALLLGTAASLLVGTLLIISPLSSGFAFEDLLGLYAIVIGSVHVITAWRLSEQVEASETRSHTLMAQRTSVPVVDEEQDAAGAVSVQPDSSSDHKPPQEWLPAAPGSRLDVGKYHRPIVLTPHPDDLEAFAGGLVDELRAPVLSVIFAGGDKGVWSPRFATMDKTDYIRVRLAEASDAARLLGVTEIIYMGFVDRGVAVTPAAVEKVVEIFERHQPDLVVSFEFYRLATPYPHPDHLATGEIVRRAVTHYQGRDRLDFLVTSTIIPNIFVDVTAVRRVKLEALACHTTQTGLNGIIFPLLEKLISRIWGAFAGVDFAEGYRLIDIPTLVRKLNRVDDPVRTP